MRSPRLWIAVILCFTLPFPSACSVNKKMTVASAASLVEDIAKASAKQSDLRVIRDGMPAYLLLMDGMVEGWPDNSRLLIAAAQSYATFASAFVSEGDRAYRDTLFRKAKGYAIRALVEQGIDDPQTSPFDRFETQLNATTRNDVPCLFWAATAWGNWINLNIASIEALAELPRVELMINRVLLLDEGFHYGGAHLFMGILKASRPKIAGGDLEAARSHFLRAIDLGQGRFLMADIYFAEYYAKKIFDKQLYVRTLEKVLETPAGIEPELTLLNTVAHQKAAEMLKDAEDYF